MPRFRESAIWSFLRDYKSGSRVFSSLNSIRNAAGHSLKSSISASIAGDTRDDPLLPTGGTSYRLFGELAGLLESRTRFAKIEGDYSWATYLGNGFSLAASARAGVLAAMGGSRVNDRFFLGGPLTVRGFRHHGLGPKDGGELSFGILRRKLSP